MFQNVALLILLQAEDRDDSHSVLSLVSLEGVRIVLKENLSAGPESTTLYMDEHCHEPRQLFD